MSRIVRCDVCGIDDTDPDVLWMISKHIPKVLKSLSGWDDICENCGNEIEKIWKCESMRAAQEVVAIMKKGQKQ